MKNSILKCYLLAVRICSGLPEWSIALFARFGVSAVFWHSGRSKMADTFLVGDSTIMLFEHEYQVPFLSAQVAAYLAAAAEHIFPCLLVIGLATRFSALALLGMTAVIQIFVYPDAWPVHTVWAASFLYLIGRGAGILSVDHWLSVIWFNKR